MHCIYYIYEVLGEAAPGYDPNGELAVINRSRRARAARSQFRRDPAGVTAQLLAAVDAVMEATPAGHDVSGSGGLSPRQIFGVHDPEI